MRRTSIHAPRRRSVGPRQRPESIEQTNIVRTVEMLGGKCYVLGTKRGTVRCIHCAKPTPEHQGTKQTPGVSDVLAFLPHRKLATPSTVLVFVEVKAEARANHKHGGMSAEQVEFREWCLAAAQHHVVGGFNAFANWLIAQGFCSEQSFAHYRVAKAGEKVA